MTLPESLEKFIEPIITMCKVQFPRRCANCGKEFTDFDQFIRSTRPLGAPQCSPEIENPFGLLSYVNCACGSTLVLQCADAEAHALFTRLLEAEVKKSGLSPQELLLAIRAEIRHRILAA